jgi:hypothetical protein
MLGFFNKIFAFTQFYTMCFPKHFPFQIIGKSLEKEAKFFKIGLAQNP